MKRILVVDDEREICTIVAEKLIKSGYAALTAFSGKEAIALAASSVPDVILLDVAMPEMDGYEACTRLRENEMLKEVPIIFLTGKDLDQKSILKRIAELGANDYLPKPSTFGDLLEKIKETIG